MSENSVGKITLDLEVHSDLAGQINSMSNLIGKNLKTSLESTTKDTFSNMQKSLNKSISGMSSSMKNIFSNLKNNLKGIFASFKDVKMPNFSLPTNQTNTSQNTTKNISPRGPPINAEVLGAKIGNVSSTLDTINARIEQQQEKLAQLRESYNMTFNQGRKNKLEEQMLKTESTINKLIGQSDKLGFQLAELDSQYASLGNSSNSASVGTSKLSNSMKTLEHNTKRAGNTFRSSHSGLSMFVGTMVKWGIIFPIIQRGITSMASGLLASLNTNQQFANSLAVVKTNLQVAFTPIFYAILPAINALMSALATLTTYVASFISALFGKSYSASVKATQGLIDAKTAMGAYGDAAQAAGKKTKGALAGFDEINTLNIQDDTGGGGGGGGADVPTLTIPDMDVSAIDSAMASIVDKMKAFINSIDFTPLKDSFNNLKTSIEPVIKTLGDSISWFMTDILAPLTRWTIEKAIPAFFDVLSGVFTVLNPLLIGAQNGLKLLWDNFLKPIASWTGGVIISVLEGLADTLTIVGTWMSDNQGVVDAIALAVESFGLAWLIVNGAIFVWNVLCGIATALTAGFAAVIGFLTSPVTLVILAIGALILIVTLLAKNWDTIKAKTIEIWNSIKDFMKGICESVGEFFRNLWTGICNTFANVKAWFSEKFTQAKNAVLDAFANVGSFFGGVWSNITNTFSNVVGWFRGKFNDAWVAIQNVFSGVGSFFSGMWNTIKSCFTNIGVAIGDAVSGAFRSAVNSVIGFAQNTINGFIRGINNCIGLINMIPGVNIHSISTLSIPKLARGGIVDAPTLAMVGEAGKEAVVPLENNTGGLDMLAEKLMSRMPQGSSGSNDRPINLVLEFTIGTLKFAKTICTTLNELGENNGGVIPINI